MICSLPPAARSQLASQPIPTHHVPDLVLYIACPRQHREATEKTLAGAGLATVWADDAAGALASLEERDRLVIVDFDDERAPGIVKEIRARRPQTLLLAVAGTSRPGLGHTLETSGVPSVLHRPLDARTIASLVRAASLRPADGARDVAANHRPADAPRDAAAGARRQIFAASPAMKAVVEAIRLAAAGDFGLLILGEAGTGRRLVARHVHAQSARASEPFLELDCAEGDGETLEMTLFGGRPSNGAIEHRPERLGATGLLHLARGGSVFLAHLAELPDRVQARLARVLRDGEAFVDAAPRPGPLPVRAMASGDREWDAALAEGRIRADLAKRVAGMRIELPALRERREDIPQLAACLLRQECEARRAPHKALDRSALALLAALPWHGNAPELRALMTTLAGRVPTAAVRVEDVLAHVSLDGEARPPGASGTLREARARFERDYIATVLKHHHGRVGEAARELGIQRTNLYRKLRSLRIPRPVNGASGSHRGR